MGAMMLENFLQISLLLLINVLSDDFLSNWSTFKNDVKLIYQKFLVSSLMSLMYYKYSFLVRYLKTLKSRLADIYYLEVSAKTGENCKDTFQLIIRETSRKDIHEDPIYTSKDLKNDTSSCTIV